MSERVKHPVFARTFAALVSGPLGKGMTKDRQRLLDGIKGRILEIGCGTGVNFQHYPPEADEVVAVEPEPYLRAKAEKAARSAPMPVSVVNATAASLPFPNGAFDAAVFSLVLCSVPSVEAALAEAFRVLRPGGRLHFYEHVGATSGPLRRVQRALDATVWPRINGGCHTARDPVSALERSGFLVDQLDRFDFKLLGIPTPVTPHVIGVATRP